MNRILAVLATLTLAACGAGTSGLPDDVKAADVAVHSRVTLVDAPAVVPATKILVIVEENHSYAQVKAQMPYRWALSQQFGYAVNSHGNYHPSQPNYVVMAAGENRGITSNSYKQISGPSIMGKTIAAGRSAKIVADGMGKANRCKQTGSSPYAFRHIPWIPFKDERALCNRYVFDYAYFASDIAAAKLANVEFLIPSNNHNGHDKSLKVADDWLKSALKYVFAGPDWKSGHLAIVITEDEDDKKSGQKILTTVIHASQNHNVVTTYLDHVSLHKTLARFGHVAPLGSRAAAANDLATAFNLPVE